jgi:hypothetical protein
MINNYAKHVPKKWSPATMIWGGMVDELKVIPTPKCKQRVILLGLGYGICVASWGSVTVLAFWRVGRLESIINSSVKNQFE